MQEPEFQLQSPQTLVVDPRTGEFYIVPADPADATICESCE